MLDLSRFLSNRLDPLAANQSITDAVQQQHARNVLAEHHRANLVNEAETQRGSMAREGIANRGLGLQERGMDWGQSKDQQEALGNYVQMLRSGRYADAAAYAETLKGLGIGLNAHPGEQPQQPQQGQMSYAQPAPTQAPADDRIDYSASNVDSIRGEPDEAQAMAEAKARVAEIGGDTSGFEPAPQQPQMQPPSQLAPLGIPTGPGRVDFSFNGKPGGTIDAQAMADEQRQLASREGEALVGMVPQRFRGLAAGLKDAPNMEALTGRLKPWMATQGDLFAGERAQMMGQTRGLSMGLGERRSAAKEVLDLIAVETAKTGKARERIDTLQQSLSMAASASSTAQRMAALQNAKQVLVGALSDRDMSFIFSSSGKWNELLMKLNAWTEGGALPEGFVNDMRMSTKLLQTEAKRALFDRAEMVSNRIKADPYFVEGIGPEWASQYGKIAFSSMTGTEAPKPLTGKRGPSSSPKVTKKENIVTKGVEPVSGRPTVDAFTQRAPTPGAPPLHSGEPTVPVPGTEVTNEARLNRPDFLR